MYKSGSVEGLAEETRSGDWNCQISALNIQWALGGHSNFLPFISLGIKNMGIFWYVTPCSMVGVLPVFLDITILNSMFSGFGQTH
jgi:hypothetical protein